MWKWTLGYGTNLMEGVPPKFNKYSFCLGFWCDEPVLIGVSPRKIKLNLWSLPKVEGYTLKSGSVLPLSCT